jgi:hypothetical protein
LEEGGKRKKKEMQEARWLQKRYFAVKLKVTHRRVATKFEVFEENESFEDELSVISLRKRETWENRENNILWWTVSSSVWGVLYSQMDVVEHFSISLFRICRNLVISYRSIFPLSEYSKPSEESSKEKMEFSGIFVTKQWF